MTFTQRSSISSYIKVMHSRMTLRLEKGYGFNIDDDVRVAQLGPFQEDVLNLIKETPRCMQKSIVVRTGKDQSQVSKVIDKLVEVGLVVKKDGRLIAQ